MPNPRPSKFAVEWYRKAQNDEHVLTLTAKEKGLKDPAFFHAHEAAEKYLKAALVALAAPVDPSFKTHNLVELYQRLVRRSLEESADVLAACRYLSQYYAASRYPGEMPAVPEDSRPTLLALARIRRFVEPLFT